MNSNLKSNDACMICMHVLMNGTTDSHILHNAEHTVSIQSIVKKISLQLFFSSDIGMTPFRIVYLAFRSEITHSTLNPHM